MTKATLNLFFLVCAALLGLAPAQALAQGAGGPEAQVAVPEFPQPEDEAEAASGGNFKVMTWNIHGGEGCTVVGDRYLRKVEEEIRRHKNLDVIALQEVHRGQANTLAVRLGFYHHFVEMRGCDNNSRDFGIAILSRHYFGESGDDRTLRPGSCKTKDVKRKVATITVRARGKLVHVYATHLTACGGADGQERQIADIRRFIDRDRDAPGRRGRFRAVLLGDFNLKPSDGPYFDLTGEFKDAWFEAARPTLLNPWGLTYPTVAPEARIDYVFIGKESGLDARDVRVTDPQTLFDIFGTRDADKLPDHLPVVARLAF